MSYEKNDIVILRDGDALTGKVQLEEYHIKTSYMTTRKLAL